jgi:hypothetical protein
MSRYKVVTNGKLYWVMVRKQCTPWRWKVVYNYGEVVFTSLEDAIEWIQDQDRYTVFRSK